MVSKSKGWVGERERREGGRERRGTDLVGHDVPEQHNVPRVDAHPVLFHDVLDLVDDRPARGFDTEDVRGFDDVV